MYKLMLPPGEESYSAEASAESVVRTQLDGGAGKYRQVLFGVSNIVTCSWICDSKEYDYLRTLYKMTREGALPFLADLIVDKSNINEYICHFIPKSFKLDSVKGLSYNVSASVEVIPNYDETDDTYNVILYNDADKKDFVLAEDLLNQIVNIDLPRILR